MSEKDLFPDKDETSLMDSFRWWERKKGLYNIIVGLSGIAGMFIFTGHIPLTPLDLMGIFAWAIAANVCYFTGFLLEPIAKYYLKSTIDFADKRSNFFWTGTILSILITISCARLSNSLSLH